MSGKIVCELLSHSNSSHLQQIYTGFVLLHKSGAIELIQRICKTDFIDKKKPPHLQDGRVSHLKVLVNKEKVVYYDTHDSFEIDGEAINEVDFYFKRSYSDTEVFKLRDKEKIFPLGLNYLVYSNGLDTFLLRRTVLDNGFNKFYNSMIGLGLDRFPGGMIYAPRADDLEFYPDFKLPPKVLFMARAFDPKVAKSEEKRQEREILNETRAHCIRLLKREFAARFLGGFMHESYPTEKFKDCLLSDGRLATKRNYMRLLKEFPICVTTTGLHGSIGWKLGEYVSYSKAIVTEPLNYRVPGRFERGVNYLDFTSAEACLEAVARLFQDQELRSELMMNNYRYHQSHLRPDSLVLNTLGTVCTRGALERREDRVSPEAGRPDLSLTI
jgi:hypothetical protein